MDACTTALIVFVSASNKNLKTWLLYAFSDLRISLGLSVYLPNTVSISPLFVTGSYKKRDLHHRILSFFPTNKNCSYFQRTPLHHITQNAIIAHTSQDYRICITRFRIYITRFSNIHHKILNIHHKIIEYT